MSLRILKYIEGDHTAYSLHLSPEQEFLTTSGGFLHSNSTRTAVHN